MDKNDERDIIGRVAHHKLFGYTRRVMSIETMIIFYLLCSCIFGIIPLIEIYFTRVGYDLLFAILQTGLLGAYLLIAVGFKIYKNIFFQTSRPYDIFSLSNYPKQFNLWITIPFLTVILIISRWLAYAKSNETNNFVTPGGIIYGGMSLMSMCLYLIIVVIAFKSMFSYALKSKQYKPIYVEKKPTFFERSF